MAVQLPKRIGRYAVDKLLGSGAMGFVYLARDEELDRLVAIKTVRRLDMDDTAREEFLQRFRNEARAAAKLHHASIVAVYDVGDDGDVGPFLVMEYVPGTTLKQLLRDRGPLDPRHVLRIAEHVGEAIDTAHSAGVIHRDIKPENLLVMGDGRAKLADFGVARVPDAALTREGQFLGTPCYAAPETLRRAEYGPRSDLFSFGTVLYEAITATRAFPGDDALSVAHKVADDQPMAPSRVAPGLARVPRSVDGVLARALAKRPEDRFQSAFALASALRSAYVEANVVEGRTREPSTSIAVADTLRMGETAREERGLSTWSRVGWLLGGLLVAGGAAAALLWAFQYGDGATLPDPLGGVDAAGVVSDGAADAAQDGQTDAAVMAPSDGSVAVDGEAPDGALEDSSVDGATDAQTPLDSMDAHEREEVAKDKLEGAVEALERGDREAARALASEAAAHDPGNEDVKDFLKGLEGRREGEDPTSP